MGGFGCSRAAAAAPVALRSLATLCLSLCPSQVLLRIVQARLRDAPGRPNATVVHLRAGDVIEDDTRSVVELLTSEGWGGYVKPLVRGGTFVSRRGCPLFSRASALS